MMGIVKYTESRRFNIGQALKDGWGEEWAGEKALIGMKLQDRKKANYKVQIEHVDWYSGILRVWFKEGGWLCFDHAIEQFKQVV